MEPCKKVYLVLCTTYSNYDQTAVITKRLVYEISSRNAQGRGTLGANTYRPNRIDLATMTEAQRKKLPPQTPKCGKFVKLSVHGTEVSSLTPNHLLPNLPKDIWQIYSSDLVF